MYLYHFHGLFPSENENFQALSVVFCCRCREFLFTLPNLLSVLNLVREPQGISKAMVCQTYGLRARVAFHETGLAEITETTKNMKTGIQSANHGFPKPRVYKYPKIVILRGSGENRHRNFRELRDFGALRVCVPERTLSPEHGLPWHRPPFR